ncbi:hypothetical protein BDK51DRAFT_52207, partial [Blyttiomyces helicus]
MFKVGQVVKCRVLTVDAEEEKMRVSLKVGRNETLVDKKSTADVDTINLNAVVDGRVISLLTDAALVELLPSQKAILVSAAQATGFTGDFADVAEGSVLPGYVRSVTDDACFIGFLGDLVGAAKIRNISDRFVTKVSDFLSTGQSVVAVVLAVDGPKRRLQLSLKESQYRASDAFPAIETAYLRSLFRERDALTFQKAAKGGATQPHAWTKRFTIGAIVDAKVKKIMPYGTIVEMEDKVEGLITQPTGGAALKVGVVVKTKIMDVDVEKKILDLIVARKGMEGGVEPDAMKKAQAAHSNGEVLDAIVEIVKEDYAIFTIASLGHAVAYASAKGFDSSRAPFNRYRVGQT